MTDFSGLSELLHLPPEAVKAYEDDDIFSGHYVRVLATFAKTGYCYICEFSVLLHHVFIR